MLLATDSIWWQLSLLKTSTTLRQNLNSLEITYFKLCITNRKFERRIQAEADDRVIAFALIEQTSTTRNGNYASEISRKTGSFDLNPSLKFSVGDAELEICNQGKGVTPATHAQWQGNVYAVPALNPGEGWTSAHQSKLVGDALKTPELSLFVKRSTGKPLTLLRQLPVTNQDDKAWLMQYISSDQSNPSCIL